MEQPIVLDNQGGSVMNVSQTGVVGTLRKETHGHEPILCFTQNQAGDVLTGTVMHSLATNGNSTGRNAPNVCYGIQANIVDRSERSGGNGLGVKEEEEAPTLTKADRHAVAFGWQNSPSQGDSVGDVIPTLDKSKTAAVFLPAATVRRLTPMECERLQGFPDGWTDVPGASDSKRYAALGNSMTTNVMHWLGDRINKVQQTLDFISIV